MPRSRRDSRSEEFIILTKAVENFLRKLIQFLVGKISLVKLQQIVRYIFIEEIEEKLKREHPNKNIPLSQLAILSGLDTRTLTKIRNSDSYRKPFHKESNFLNDFALGAQLLHMWSQKQPYIDQSTGNPKVLPISGKSPSFESLFDESIKSRGITSKALLKRLSSSGEVAIEDSGKLVRLVERSYLPSNAEHKLGAIEIGFSALGNMVDTIVRNIRALESGEQKFFQRGAWTYKLSHSEKNKLRSELRELLEKTDSEARKIIEKHEGDTDEFDQITAGVSFFYFEDPWD